MSANNFQGRYDSIEHATDYLVQLSLKRIEKLYGPNGSNPKEAHNVEHTREVMSATKKIVKLGLVRSLIEPVRDVHLLNIAAAWHDARHGYRNHPGYNEYVSAEMARRAMSATGVFSDREVAAVGGMIKGTQVMFIDGKVVQQANPNDYTQCVIADADLSSLGQPFDYYWHTTSKLYQEVKKETGNKLAIATFGLGFIKGHVFLTPEAAELFPYQDENIAELQQIVA